MDKFCIIGSGYILLKHIEAIRSVGGEITEVINENSFIDYKELINKTKAEYVVVLTPNYLHADIAEYAARKGKIVLCEKPLALTEKDIERLSIYERVFTVLQLRYHPLVPEMRKLIKSENNIIIDVAVWRDKSYDLGWKGNEKKSGGIYFNLGVHYIDLVYWLCGKTKVNLKIKLTTKSKNPHRTITINGKSFNLSSKENLSEENLHRFVYQDLIKGKGVQPKELVELTKRICQLCNKAS